MRKLKFCPRKLEVTIMLKGGHKMYMACDKFSYSKSEGLTYEGASALGKYTNFRNGFIDLDAIVAIKTRPIRLWHVYFA